ncbi:MULTISPECIES: GtrA family protein [unclassified Rathayibacter]|uniref:GtrA family protein n=1 Tax=unclassified Rathayibacter TaxID=2609250 RepID=UPI00188CDC64|nr:MULTISPECIES: GtrA family protein [unclassified Rathayibacter]MBF4461020.1 GtrA family protein [Rathayibacter sp. VKM Ac-2879]MBF4502431.1 GtrA family protein [Rathayibacter sp. VKM Ac-2878]
MRTASLYVFFAILATAVNLGTQMLAELVLSGGWATPIAVLCGTLTGVITKYVLDKRYIFRHETMNAAHGIKTFVLYGVMSGVTTLVFWGFEFGFEALFGTDLARYTGAVIGLAIGYAAKYFLDKNITFQGPREEPA